MTPLVPQIGFPTWFSVSPGSPSRLPNPVLGSPWFPTFSSQPGSRFPLVPLILKIRVEPVGSLVPHGTGEPQVPTPGLNIHYYSLKPLKPTFSEKPAISGHFRSSVKVETPTSAQFEGFPITCKRVYSSSRFRAYLALVFVY